MTMESLGSTASDGIPGGGTEATHSTRTPTMVTALRCIADKGRMKGDRAASEYCVMEIWTSQGSGERGENNRGRARKRKHLAAFHCLGLVEVPFSAQHAPPKHAPSPASSPPRHYLTIPASLAFNCNTTNCTEDCSVVRPTAATPTGTGRHLSCMVQEGLRWRCPPRILRQLVLDLLSSTVQRRHELHSWLVVH